MNMGYFRNLHLKLKLRKILLLGDGGNRGKGEREANGKRLPWMAPVSHGYHVVEDLFGGEMTRDPVNSSADDSVVVQREQIGEAEVWFFGVVDARIRDGLTKHLQSNLFDVKPKESQLRRKSKEALRKAHLSAREAMREKERVRGSASAIVISGEKLVMANMGDYRAVVCRDGEAYQMGTKRRWLRKFIPGAIRMPKVRILSRDPRNAERAKPSKGCDQVLIVGEERIDSNTEFVILASAGIWEVMKHQEAVNLIRHLEDPQEAAECLAKEALTRMSKTHISCLVFRFD